MKSLVLVDHWAVRLQIFSERYVYECDKLLNSLSFLSNQMDQMMAIRRLKIITHFCVFMLFEHIVLISAGRLSSLRSQFNWFLVVFQMFMVYGQRRNMWSVVSLLFLQSTHQFGLRQRFSSLLCIFSIVNMSLYAAVHMKNFHFFGTLDFHNFLKWTANSELLAFGAFVCKTDLTEKESSLLGIYPNRLIF